MEHRPDRLAHRRLAPLLRQRLSRRGLDLGEDRGGSRRPGGLAPLAQDLGGALRGPPHDDAGARSVSPLADRQLRGSRRLAGARHLRPLSRVDRRAPGKPAPQVRRKADQLTSRAASILCRRAAEPRRAPAVARRRPRDSRGRREVSAMAAPTTARVNHLLSAGTTYQGARLVAVWRKSSLGWISRGVAHAGAAPGAPAPPAPPRTTSD